MSVCWATQHSNKKTKPEYSLGSFVGRPSGVLMGFYFFFSFLVAFFCIYFELATFALKLMMMTMIKLMCQLPSIAELLNA